jgi:DNA-directed RNA polymerase III subunit RPC6
MIFDHIRGAGRNGMWKKSIQAKTNLHENTITRGIKELINHKLIKEFKTAKNPTKRMYIVARLEPTEENRGGGFYNDGELDEVFVAIVAKLVVQTVEAVSWVEQRRPRHHERAAPLRFRVPKGPNHHPLASRSRPWSRRSGWR